MHSDSGRSVDSVLAKYAVAALVLFAGFEFVSLLIGGLYLPASMFTFTFLFGFHLVRRLPKRINSLRSIGLLSLSWAAVILSVFYGVQTVEGPPLLLVASFILLRGVRALCFAIANLFVLYLIRIISVDEWTAQIGLGVAFLYLLAATLLAYLIANSLLSARKEAQTNSRSDVTTGVGNRSALVEEMDELIDLYQRYRVETSAVSIRIENLEPLLVEYGEARVSQLLVELVNVWQSRIRNTDRLYRYGDDCFVLLLPGTSSSNARTLIEDLERACKVYEFSQVTEVTLQMNIESLDMHSTWEEWLAALVRTTALASAP